MPSSSNADAQPSGEHRVPRKGGRTLTKRAIRIESERRSKIDLHYLGQALLRLAQEQYDLEGGPNRPVAYRLEGAPDRAHVPHTGANGPPRGPGRGGARGAGTPGPTGAMG